MSKYLNAFIVFLFVFFFSEESIKLVWGNHELLTFNFMQCVHSNDINGKVCAKIHK